MKDSETNIFDYLKWRGDLKLKNAPLDRIDFGILAQLSLIDLKGIVPSSDDGIAISIHDAYKKYFAKDSLKTTKIGLIIPSSILALLVEVGHSKRFRDILMSDYICEINIKKEEQFSALTYKISDNCYCISFSGTDDSIIGWKENFNMIYKSPVPAQLKATDYVTKIMTKYKNANFYLCGHSKGGNLAIYSSLTVQDEFYERIIKVLNFDGPGLSEELLNKIQNHNYQDKILTILPQSSTVGRLFEHKEEIVIIRSVQFGLYQHDMLSWQVMGKDFIYEKQATKNSKLVIDRINLILKDMTMEEKQKLVDNLYVILDYTEAKDLITLSMRKKKLLEGYFKLPKEERKYVYGPLRKLFADTNVQKIILSSIRAFYQVNKDDAKTTKQVLKIKEKQ